MRNSPNLLNAEHSPVAFPDLEPAPSATIAGAGGTWRAIERLKKKSLGPAEKLGSIRSTTMSFLNMHEHGELLVNYLRARRSIFIDRLNWSVAETDGLEFDQYDTPFCRWVVLHEFGEVLAGVRLLPTTATCGVYSYMLRDAQKGILEDFPSDVLFIPAPVDPNVWEASRFFVTDAVPAVRRSAVQRLLFNSMSLTARDNGASHILGIVPSVWSRWARRLDAEATPIGTKFSIDGTISQSVLFHVNRI